MIYTEDSISEKSRKIIAKSDNTFIEKETRKLRIFNICMLLSLFFLVIAICVLVVAGKSSQHLWIWGVLVFVMVLKANSDYSTMTDIAKVSINPEIIRKIRNAKSS